LCVYELLVVQSYRVSYTGVRQLQQPGTSHCEVQDRKTICNKIVEPYWRLSTVRG